MKKFDLGDYLKKEALQAMNDIEQGLMGLHKSGVKKLPKSIKKGLDKIDKQFNDFEKMIRKSKKK